MSASTLAVRAVRLNGWRWYHRLISSYVGVNTWALRGRLPRTVRIQAQHIACAQLSTKITSLEFESCTYLPRSELIDDARAQMQMGGLETIPA